VGERAVIRPEGEGESGQRVKVMGYFVMKTALPVRNGVNGGRGVHGVEGEVLRNTRLRNMTFELE
jgi:hypothetical protein